ncbi:MAG: LCP family protein [Clostridiales bacterium]|nr:LCP family protein [Clostridiales bacterium]
MSAKKRKSNWYVYLFAFLATLGIFIFAVFLFNKITNSKNDDDNKQIDQDELNIDETHNFTFLATIATTEDDIPHTFFIVDYKAVGDEITIIALPSDLKTDTGYLSTTYQNSGINGALKTINSILGTDIQKYINTRKFEFVNMFDTIGNISITVPFEKTFTATDTGEEITLPAGNNIVNGTKLFDYLNQIRVDESGYEYIRTASSVISEIFNSKAKSIQVTDMDSIFRRLVATADTNLTTEDYEYRKKVVLNTFSQTATPFVYYVPNGEYDANNAFNISENSINSIKNIINP